MSPGYPLMLGQNVKGQGHKGKTLFQLKAIECPV